MKIDREFLLKAIRYRWVLEDIDGRPVTVEPIYCHEDIGVYEIHQMGTSVVLYVDTTGKNPENIHHVYTPSEIIKGLWENKNVGH